MLRRRTSTCDLADNVTSLFCGLPACVNNWALLAFLLLLFFSFFLKLNVKLTCLCLSRWWHHIFTPFFFFFLSLTRWWNCFLKQHGERLRGPEWNVYGLSRALWHVTYYLEQIWTVILASVIAQDFFAIVELLRPVKTTVSSPLNKMQYRRCSCWSHLRLVFEVFGWTLAVDFARFVT